jgi:rhodanese-related sulfurtransferase
MAPKEVQMTEDIRRAILAAAALVVALGSIGSAQVVPPTTGPRMTVEAFRLLHAAGRARPVDVRSPSAFRAGHIPGAINVPLAEVDRRAAEIGRWAAGAIVVTYCSCPSEQTSLDAARRLRAQGLTDVVALIGGYPAWKSER